jgi:nicotinamide-nucleotide amidase
MPVMSESALLALAEQLGQQLLSRKLSMSTAESCTGGWIAKLVTDVAGSSEWFDRGFVTYSNLSKQEMLGVAEEALENYGAVSDTVARQMADGALARSQADISVAVTGIAGPGGGSPQKPVGTVWFAWADSNHAAVAELQQFHGDRDAVRRQAVQHAIEGLLERL